MMSFSPSDNSWIKGFKQLVKSISGLLITPGSDSSRFNSLVSIFLFSVKSDNCIFGDLINPACDFFFFGNGSKAFVNFNETF